MSLLKTVEVIHNPNNLPVDRAVIWLHGLGANGHDFEPVVPDLGLDGNHGIRFVFPHAPAIPVTINQGYVMPAWYDILEMSLERKIDTAQIEQSAPWIGELIAREAERGVSPEHIVIAGFSQGGAVAYQTALTYDKPLAGLLTLSTYLATKDSLTLSDANKNLNIAIHHGTQDPVVPVQLGQEAKAWLESKGYQPQFYSYPMAHQVCMPQLKIIGKWLNDVLA